MRDLLPALEGDRQRQAHAAAQGMPEGHRGQIQVRAQRGPGRRGPQGRRQARFGQLRLDLATAAGPMRVADQGAQLAAQALRARHRHPHQPALAGIGVVVLELRQCGDQIVEAGHRGIGGERVFAHRHRMRELFQHDGAAFEHALDRWARLRVGQAGIDIGQRQQLQPYALAQLGDDAEALHGDRARAMLAMQHHHRVEHFLGGRRRGAGFRTLACDAGQLTHQVGQREALRAIALQGPGRQCQYHLEQAAGEDQCRHARSLLYRQAHVGADHQQDHAGQPHPRCHRAQCHQQAAAKAKQQPGDHQCRRVVADPDAEQRGQARCQRGHQHALQTRAIRARLVGEHGVERAGTHGQTGGDMPGGHTDRQRQHYRGGVAQRNAQWHVARLEVDQRAQHGIGFNAGAQRGCGACTRPTHGALRTAASSSLRCAALRGRADGRRRANALEDLCDACLELAGPSPTHASTVA